MLKNQENSEYDRLGHVHTYPILLNLKTVFFFSPFSKKIGIQAYTKSKGMLDAIVTFKMEQIWNGQTASCLENYFVIDASQELHQTIIT